MKYAFTGILLFLTITTNARQLSLQELKPGWLVTEYDSISGMIGIDLISNTALLKNESGITNYPARDVVKLVLYNNQESLKTFISGYWGFQKDAIFFEVLVEGETSLLFRQNLKFDRFEEDISSTYFTRIGNAIYSLGSKREIIRLFKNKNYAADIVKEYKLELDNREDLIFLFENAVEHPASEDDLF